jgi:hypothetical protein
MSNFCLISQAYKADLALSDVDRRYEGVSKWGRTAGPRAAARPGNIYCNRNWTVTVRCIGTGLPSSIAGSYLH